MEILLTTPKKISLPIIAYSYICYYIAFYLDKLFLSHTDNNGSQELNAKRT